jgi:hypothetical protein
MKSWNWRGLIVTFIVNKMKKLIEGEISSHWVGPKIWAFPEISSTKTAHYLFSSDRKCNRKNATNLVILLLFISFQWWVPDHSFKWGILFWKFLHTLMYFSSYYFSILGVQNNSECSVGLWGFSKSTFMLRMPVNGKYGHSAPDFAHMPYWRLLSLTFSYSSQLTLCVQHDKILTFISLSLLYTLAEMSLY